MNSILITICARGGSKGIPGKNIKELNGIPLIAYTIKTARYFSEYYGADISLSTDNLKIKALAEKYEIFTDYMRPAELATDSSGKIAVIKDILMYEEANRNKEYDIILDLDVTSPLRNLNDLNMALNMLNENEDALNIFSVSPAKRNPYFNMVEEKDNGFVGLIKNIGDIQYRQNAPKVYDMNASFCIYRRKYFEYNYKISITNKSLIYIVPHICFDLDEKVDFLIMDIMIRDNLLDFEL